MPFQMLVNILIAFLWIFFQDNWSSMTFLEGYIIGIVILLFTRRFFKTPFYLLFVYAALKLVFVFVRELIASGITVMRQVLRPTINVAPGIFRIDTDLE